MATIEDGDTVRCSFPTGETLVGTVTDKVEGNVYVTANDGTGVYEFERDAVVRLDRGGSPGTLRR